jgi:hypothetical protein
MVTNKNGKVCYKIYCNSLELLISVPLKRQPVLDGQFAWGDRLKLMHD